MDDDPAQRRAEDRVAPAPLPGIEVLSRLGHDLRSPLDGIIGLARIMLLRLATGPADPDQQKRQLELMQTSAQHMLRTVERIVEVARVDTAATMPATPLADCRELVAEVVTRVQPTTGDGPRLIADIPADPVPFRGEPDLIRRLLTELVDNAVKYAEAPAILVRVLRATGDSGPAIEVSDAGPGIAPSEQARIFEPMTRGASAAAGSVAGSGLGLYLAARLADRCGVGLDLRSEPGRGSTFVVQSPDPAVAGSRG
jgi:signal transduction histidine kinase